MSEYSKYIQFDIKSWQFCLIYILYFGFPDSWYNYTEVFAFYELFPKTQSQYLEP